MSDPSTDYPPLPEALVVPVYDNHSHLEMAPLPGDRGSGHPALDYRDALGRASSVGVRGVVQVGTDLPTSRWGAEVAAREPRVLAAVALHPSEAPGLVERGELDEQLAAIDELASRPRVRAVGETGLDYHWVADDAGRAAQLRSFEGHIAIAKERGLALQIHDRDAHQDVFDTLLRVGAPERVVFHCFSGHTDFARAVTERGWYVSFSGTVTFRNAQYLRDALEAIPRRYLLCETDAPFLTPTPFRGRPNSSYLLPHTLRAMAETLHTEVSMLAAQISSNTELVYGHWDDEPVTEPPGPFDPHPEGSPGPQ